MMAENVVFTVLAPGQEHHGREGMMGIRPFAGIPATGRDVRVPLCVVYQWCTI
jgi:hypothetical protein